MKASTVATSLAAATLAGAQRPADQSICDYYTTALLKENNATNQETLLTLVVNTAVIGNYTTPNVGIKVPGILANGTGEYEGVSLLPYFSGALVSTNAGGPPRAVNFLDDGGAAPLMMNKPANGTNSAQYRLLTHLYQYFGGLLGCSQFANTTMQYQGETSQYNVHKYMALNNAEVGYFISQVGAAAASFGVTNDDVKAVGKALNDAFGYRCAAPAAIPATATPALQAMIFRRTAQLPPPPPLAPLMMPLSSPPWPLALRWLAAATPPCHRHPEAVHLEAVRPPQLDPSQPCRPVVPVPSAHLCFPPPVLSLWVSLSCASKRMMIHRKTD